MWGQILARLEEKIAGSDSLTGPKRDKLFGALSTEPAYKRFLRRTKSGLMRIDRGAVSKEEKLDGKFLLSTSNETLSAQDIALGYKSLYEVEDGWRRPVEVDHRATTQLAQTTGPHPCRRPALLARTISPSGIRERSLRRPAQHSR
ncbi:MAG: hypothetical protein ACP5P1_11340 [Acidimicrobiales bacterium]